MNATQISIFIENKKGRLATITQILEDNKINIRALSLADTSEFGILRLIVDQPDLAYEAFKSAGVTSKLTEVIAVLIDDTPGGLNMVLQCFGNSDVNLEYMYAYLGKNTGKAITIFRVTDTSRAIEVLEENNISVLTDAVLLEL